MAHKKKVKFLQDYATRLKDEEVELGNFVANDLAKLGIVEYLEEETPGVDPARVAEQEALDAREDMLSKLADAAGLKEKQEKPELQTKEEKHAAPKNKKPGK